jgi:hypothetical protein
MATPAVVASTYGTSSDGGNTAATSAIDTTGATLIVINLSGLANAATVSDSKTNTWTRLSFYNQGGSGTNLYYALNPTVGSGHTFSVGSSAIFPALHVAAFSGVDSYSGENGEGGGFGTSLIVNLSNTGVNDTLYLSGAWWTNTAGPISDNFGFTTIQYTDTVPAQSYGGYIAWKVANAGASVGFSWSPADNVAVSAAWFLPITGGAGQPIVRRFGGVPAVGGHHSGNRGRGRMWGRTRQGLIVPRRLAA